MYQSDPYRIVKKYPEYFGSNGVTATRLCWLKATLLVHECTVPFIKMCIICIYSTDQ